MEDGLLELLETGARFDPQLSHQRAVGVAEDLQRLGLAIAAVQREHQLGSQPLTKGPIRDQALQLGDRLRVSAQLEVGVDELLDRLQPQLLQRPDLILPNGS